MHASSAFALFFLHLHNSAASSSTSCLDAMQKVETQRSELQKIERDLNLRAQTESKFVACFTSHYPLVQYGCAKKAGKLEMNEGRSTLRQHIEFADVGEHALALKEGERLKQAMELCKTQCKTATFQSTNFEGTVLCLETPCSVTQLVMKNPMDGKLDAKEIEPQQDKRMGVPIDEVYRLS
jgi:hypothetical protein